MEFDYKFQVFFNQFFMKSVRTLRLLSLLGFLLLMAPFYDQCNGHGMKKAEPAAEEIMIDTTAVVIDTTAVETPSVNSNTPILVEKENSINTDSITEIKRKEAPFYVKAYDFIDDSETLNAYEFAVNSKCLFEGSFSELKKDIKQGIKDNDYSGFFMFLRIYCFLFIILFSISMLFLSFFNRVKLIHKFSKINLVLLFITIICTLFFDPFFETYKQIKWGYYAFTLVQIGIYYTSKLQISKAKYP
jgi:hypothetical protein